MSLQEQQNLLAKLYTTPELRDEFFARPHETGARFGMTEKESDDLALVVRDELEYFASSLIQKRLQEVEKLLPLTSRFAGGDFRSGFREFAATFVPNGVKKHLEDALAFCDFLAAREVVPEIARFERKKLAFAASDDRFACCLTSVDPVTGERTRTRLAIWSRRGGIVSFRLI